MEEYTWKEDLKERFKQGKAKTIQFGKDRIEDGKKAINWIKENPIAASMIMAAGGSALHEINSFVKNTSEAKYRRQSEMEFYDRTSNQRLRFKHKPSKWQLNEANRRHLESGDPYSKIYRDMGLL